MVCFSLLIAGVSAEVAVLTDGNFEAFAGADKPALVEFYAPWCGHCKALEPELERAAVELDGVVQVGKVDATKEEGLAGKFGVNGYPTLKWFPEANTKDVFEYDGGRTSDTIVSWVKGMLGPAVGVASAPQQPTFAKCAVTLFGPSMLDVFEEFAKSKRHSALWTYVASDYFRLQFDHVKQQPIVVDGEPTSATLKENFDKHSFPLFGPLTGETFGKYTARDAGLVWAMFPLSTSESAEQVADQHRTMMTEVAQHFVGKYSVVWTDTIQFKGAIESMLGITEFPAIAVHKKAGDKKKYIMPDQPFSAAGIIAFIDGIESGEVQPQLKSEEPPPSDSPEVVKTVVGVTMREVLLSETQDVLFEVYAPWCGHCKKLEPELQKLGKKFTKEGLQDLVLVAKMDGTANDSPLDNVEWSGFPTLFYFKHGNPKPIKYNAEREAKAMWKWIKKNSDHGAEIQRRVDQNKASAKTQEL
mmetsp:Transcript_18353/g.44210  ORF Transcript_18353/g.44210 Transcript_18353/m.44210 type:complete len:471 (+) Transcript_18353:33-1445(+)